MPNVWGRGATRPKVRLHVLDRDGWMCQMQVCLCPDGRQIDPAVTDPDDPWSSSIDHVKARADNGGHAYENLRAAHRECNMAAGRHYNERTLRLRRKRQRYRANRAARRSTETAEAAS